MSQSCTKKKLVTLGYKEEELGKRIVGIAFRIHQSLGPGLLESVYAKCFCYELNHIGIFYETQKAVDIYYGNQVIKNGLRLDFLVEDCVIIELKAQENYHKVWEAQLLSYLKLTEKRLGFLINFHVPLIKEGIKRMVL